MALEYYTFSNNTDLLNFLNETLANDNLSFGVSSSSNNAVTMTGKLWNSSNANNTMITQNNMTPNIFLDIENHFLLIQNSNTASGDFKTSDQLNYTFGLTCYVERDSDPNNPAFYCVTTALNNINNIYFANATGLTYSATVPNIFNVTSLSSYINSLDLGDDFDLIPAYIGIAKMKKLWVCNNNRCAIGRVVNTGDRKFKCIGRQIFYEITGD